MGNSFLHLIWILINISSWLTAIYLFIHYTKLINKKINTFAATFFVIVVISLINSISPNKTSNNTINLNKFNSNGNLDNSTVKILEENYLSKIFISLQYQYDNNQINTVPISTYTNQSGITAGINWNQDNIEIQKISNDIYRYQVIGQYKWHILGINILTFPKNYTGELTIEPLGR